VGGHRHQHRAADDRRVGRLGGRGARSNPYSHSRGPQPGAEARAAYGPAAEIDAGAEDRGPPATGAGRDARGTRAQLPRRKEHDFEAYIGSMLEYLAPGFLYSLAKDGVAAFRRMRRPLTPSEVVAIRQKWKPVFDDRIWEAYKNKRGIDVYIRDIRRINTYPDLKQTKKGISSWFRASLLSTYHRGILVGLRMTTLTKHGADNQWRFTNYAAGEQGDIKVILSGNIRYEDIDNVNWNGDEYLELPHIYCFFTHKRQPYEHLGFYTERSTSGGLPFYTEVAPYDQVQRVSRKLGLKDYG
jgi:hypothetical protein